MAKFRVFTFDIQRKEWEVEAETEEDAISMFAWEEPEEVSGEVEVVDEYWDGIEVEFAEESEEE